MNPPPPVFGRAVRRVHGRQRQKIRARLDQAVEIRVDEHGNLSVAESILQQTRGVELGFRE